MGASRDADVDADVWMCGCVDALWWIVDGWVCLQGWIEVEMGVARTSSGPRPSQLQRSAAHASSPTCSNKTLFGEAWRSCWGGN